MRETIDRIREAPDGELVDRPDVEMIQSSWRVGVASVGVVSATREEVREPYLKALGESIGLPMKR